MHIFLSIVIHTANILGIFNDPFEFAGDYGPEINPIRQKVFETVISPEALAKNLTDAEVRELMGEGDFSEEDLRAFKSHAVLQAIHKEKEWGPTLSQLITPDLIEEIKNKQIQLVDSFTYSDLDKIINFIEKYKNQKVFRFLRNTPPGFLSLDKTLKDQAAREGNAFDLPILGSTGLLEGHNGFELKKHLLDSLFVGKVFILTNSSEKLKKTIHGLDGNYLRDLLGELANNEDLEAFASPAGQVFFFWMYHALDLHLISSIEKDFIPQVNNVKKTFAATLGDPLIRAWAFRNKAFNSGVIFTQESDAWVPQVLTSDQLFLSVERQNPLDGTLIFLRSSMWEPDYRVISVKEYEENGCMNVIVATRKKTGQKFLLASCHGHSTQPEDGRRQISLVMEIYQALKKEEKNLQLIIGTDANTKSKIDVQMLKEHLDSLGLIATDVGPTTVKRRMVTAQHAKAGKWALDQEDYLITLKPDKGGRFQFSHTTVGFQEHVDLSQPLPNQDNLSDHYPVGATLVPLETR